MQKKFFKKAVVVVMSVMMIGSALTVHAEEGVYTVKRGDNLSKIAKEVYGSKEEWKTIYEANKGIIKNANIVYVGQQLVLPGISSETTTDTSTETTTETTTDTSTETTTEATSETHVYTTYAAFVRDFTFENGILTVTTEDVGLEDYPIPEEMKFSFSYPVADGCKWIDTTSGMDEGGIEGDSEEMYEWLAFYLENCKYSLNDLKSGVYSDITGREFIETDEKWHFTVENGQVVNVFVDADET